ncbi:MAG TPA: MlaD family protein [Kofleriaceae bacterium]|jgi:paraquat-inducible protein B
MRPVTDFKLGLFALAAIASFVVAVLALGMHGRAAPSREYHTLFDETVQGLDIGAPLKYRGVEIGHVARIEIAADRRRVDVAFAVDARAADRLSLDAAPTLRAQLAGQGLTGVKFVDLDLGDAVVPPPPRGYFASAPSLGKQLEAAGTQLGHSLPLLVDDARATLHRADALLDDLRGDAPHLVAALDEARATLHGATQLVPRAGAALAKLEALAGDASAAAGSIRRLVEHVDESGLAASATRATDAAGELGHRLLDSSDSLDGTLRDLGDAARAIRDLLGELEREPDMLVKGHTVGRHP